MHHLEGATPDEVDELIGAFTSSAAFGDHVDDLLLYGLKSLRTLLPQTTINACERAVEIAGAGLSDLTGGEWTSSTVSPS